ncbi:hypothetical protein A5679_13745 [Mycobacterium scrofulaceum]|uniref:Uncharacterized protein n=1 Tax=Mycobacterium scrofulaceum TaxID=1783 RepID=A0A1A2VXI9_MYCSC|nr:hypothetical protein [Mycobacterium scrofulaceum]OBI05371.1 hypothetical protein A5679_13745 [Mycobacterium scrofulaceum]
MTDNRYGPLTFAVALLHAFVVDFVTWLFVLPMWPLVVIVLPATLGYVGIGALVARASGGLGQIGRGMMIGSLSGPLSLLIFIPAFIAAHAIGPI